MDSNTAVTSSEEYDAMGNGAAWGWYVVRKLTKTLEQERLRFPQKH